MPTYPVPQGATEVTVDVKEPVFTIPPPLPDPNEPPTANAGTDVVITLPVNSVTLRATATDTDGTIAAVLWEQTSGMPSNIVSASMLNTVVNNLTEGVYTYRLTVTDNEGAKSFDYVNVTVKAAVPVPPDNGMTVVYQSGYDTLQDVTNDHNQLGTGTVSTTVFKTGPGSFKSIVRRGASEISSGWRSEVQYDDNLSPDNVPMEIEYDTLWEATPNVNGLSFQIHGGKQGTSGQMSMWIGGGKFMVQRNVDGKSYYQSGSLMTIAKNKWYHFKWSILFSTSNSGYVRLDIDGQRYFDSGLVKSSDGSGQWIKTGQNLFASPGVDSIVYFDNFVVRHQKQ